MQHLELLVTAGLVVTIWIIQILHYPTFLFIQRESFVRFEAFHTSRISIIVIPLMLTEGALALVNPRALVTPLVVLVWLSTFLLQVPCHNKLQAGFDEAIIRRLVKTNWIRTILWSLKLIVLGYLFQAS
jgi:hypothetical protein